MKTHFECIACFLRQTLDAARFASDDETLHETVLRGVLHKVGDMDLHQTPPMMGAEIHRMIRRLCGHPDPYRGMKDKFNRMALDWYPDLKNRIQHAPDPLDMAVRFAIAGNVIDFGARSSLDRQLVAATIQTSLTSPLLGDVDALRNAVERADRILYLGDNTGEIVFDRLLVETLPATKVTFAVRGYPVINDATVADAEAVGLTDLVPVIDNGSDAPGTVLAECSAEFRKQFAAADLVIAKGQGNYETLSDVSKHIFFVLKAKCPVIAGDIGCEVGSLIAQEHG